MKIVFANDDIFNAYYEWTINDKKIAKKIMNLIKDIARTPYTGLGKPEPLKYELSGYWSREITQEHRLVYKVEDETMVILSCKYHYDRENSRKST
jgi:toxin YoeB